MTNEIIVADSSARKYYFIAAILVVIMLLAIAVTWTSLPRQLPLFLTYPWGEGRLANKSLILLLPGLSMAFITGNVLIGKPLKFYPVILTRIMAVMSLLLAIMFALSLFGTINSIL